VTPIYAETETINKTVDPIGNSGTAAYSSDSATTE
jgi:hypothetical protein